MLYSFQTQQSEAQGKAQQREVEAQLRSEWQSKYKELQAKYEDLKAQHSTSLQEANDARDALSSAEELHKKQVADVRKQLEQQELELHRTRKVQAVVRGRERD